MNKIKKAIIAGSAIAVFSGVNLYVAFANTGKVSKETVRLREEASTDSKIIVNLDLGDEVEIVGEEGDWYKVKFKNYEGYMYKEYIDAGEVSATKPETTPEATPEETKTPKETSQEVKNNSIVDKKANYVGSKITISKEQTMYLKPLLFSSKIVTIPEDTELEVTQEVKNWIKVTYKGKNGWIIKPVDANVESNTVSNYDEKEETEETTEEDTTNNITTSRTGKVNAELVNVRKTASTSADVITTLNKDAEVNILGEDGEFYKISTKNITEGYIAKRLIDEDKVSSRSGMRDGETSEENVEAVEEVAVVEQPVAEAPVEEAEEEPVYQEYVEEEQETYYEEESSYTAPSYNAQTGNEVVDFALEFEGYNYVYGGTSPETGFDCTGFAYYIYNNCGIDLARTIGYQMETGESVDFYDMEPGDLIIFYDSGFSGPGHVGIYIGDDEFIHASNPSRGVRIDSVYSSYYNSRIIDIRRIQ